MSNNTIWFTSDSHFGSKRTLEFSRRPFSSVKEMNETIVNNWNEIVKENDLVYHLGDFGDYSICRQLNGKIMLLMGNYEKNGLQNNEKLAKKLEYIYGFHEVFTCTSLKRSFNGNEYYLLCHEPRYGKDQGRFVLFGHIHQLQMIKRFGLNVGVDCHFFKPIDLKVVKFYKDAIENHYDENVFLG